MKKLLPLTLLALAAPLAATEAPVRLAGVSDQETTIPSGGVSQYHRGKGDTLFVLGRTGHWYRLGLNQGCLSATSRIDSLSFDYSNGTQRIDRFTSVGIKDSRGSFQINCKIDSIRQSEAPPQIDSKSRVTLD